MIEITFLRKNSVALTIISGAVLFSLEVLLLISAAIKDNNFTLDGNNIGLFEHQGIWVILAGDLILMLIIALLMKLFLQLDKKIPIKPSNATKKYLAYSKEETIRAILLQTRHYKLLYLSIGAGALFWLNNAVQTLDPVRFYGNDVFDSINHLNSYIAVRIVLGTSWIILYPVCACISLHAAISLFKVLKCLKDKHWLDFNIFHPDKCGGFSFLGNLNMLFVAAVFIIYLELLSVLLTHDKWNPGLIGGFVIISAIFIAVTFIIIYPAIKYLSEKKSVLLMRFYRHIKQKRETQDILTYQWVNHSLTFSPYSHYQRILLAIARFSPLITVFIRLKLLGVF